MHRTHYFVQWPISGAPLVLTRARPTQQSCSQRLKLGEIWPPSLADLKKLWVTTMPTLATPTSIAPKRACCIVKPCSMLTRQTQHKDLTILSCYQTMNLMLLLDDLQKIFADFFVPMEVS